MSWKILLLILGAVAIVVLAFRLWRLHKDLRQIRHDLEQRNRQLTQLLMIGDSLRLGFGSEAMMQKLIHKAHQALDFNLVVLNLIDRDRLHIRTVAHAGLDNESRKVVEGAIYPWNDFADLMQERFRTGNSYFIPRGLYSNGSQNSWPLDDALLVPVKLAHDEIVGVLSLDRPVNEQPLTQETLHILDVFANLVAVAIENDRLYKQLQQELVERKQAEESLRKLNEELENRVMIRTIELTKTNASLIDKIEKQKQVEIELIQRNRELLSLQSAASATTSSLDIAFVLETVTWEMVNLLKVEGCTISAWDQEDDTISAIAEYSLTSWEEPESPDKVCSLSDYPLRKRVLVEKFAQQITINDPEIDYAELVYMQQTDLKVVLLAPMIFQDRALGLVELKDSRSERTFTDREISLIQMLANQAASALENARLYEHAQEEIAERKRAEEQIKNSLKEKEVLLKEIHHRVKNNLQVISSLLHLQSQSIENESTLEIFKESQNRVRSMALIHEKLYRSQDLAQIDFAQYIRNLTAYLIRSYKRDFSPVALKINAHGVLLGIDTAVPCGLIINELVSNALKHAFPANSDLSSGRKEGSENEICIGLSINEEQQVNLVVSDNGVGFPEEVDFQNTESLGMQLVNTLTTQLDGEVKLHINGGTEFRITFRVQ